MPATVALEENGHMLHIVFQDPVTFEELLAVEKEANRWSDASPYDLHTLIDARKLRGLPQGFLKFRKADGLTNMKSGTTAVVGASIYVQTLAETIFKLTRNTNTRFFATNEIDKAIAFLRHIIASNPAASDS